MELSFLGSGSAFCLSPDNYQSNLLLTSPGGRRLLLDCGSDARFSLAALGLCYGDITDIYISHLHADHVGGLEYMGFSSRFGDGGGLQNLYISDTLVDDLWKHSLSGGMGMIEGVDAGKLSDFFVPHPVPATGSFKWEGVEFQLVPTPHVVGDRATMYSYGLVFETDGQRVFFTSDTLFAFERLAGCLEQADLVFHDCETSEVPTGVHAHYRELLGLPEEIRRKTWLYHYSDGPLPDALADGFRGFVRRGQVFRLGREPAALSAVRADRG
ncbi:MAG: MBL fold metallo-hydrolase [Chromatiales bacterium]|jgi:ribonuclease BN (tRNA processing enzyme)